MALPPGHAEKRMWHYPLGLWTDLRCPAAAACSRARAPWRWPPRPWRWRDAWPGSPDGPPPPPGAGPDIQFDIAALLAAPPQTSGTGVAFQMPPVHTVFVTGRLERDPGPADQAMLASALARLEAAYPFDAANLLTFVSYGIPYFRRLPGGLAGRLVSSRMPRLLSDRSRPVLEEARPGPTDVSPGHPGVTKLRYQVPVVIEANDMLLTLRSDHASFLSDALAWLGGSNSLRGRAVASPALRGLLTLHVQPAHVHPDRPAAGGRAPGRATVRPLHPARVTDVDGLHRPAGRRVRARRHLHVRG